jgi:hypothetical protein
MSHQSSAALLALHAVRVTGMASTERAAARYGLPRAETHELLEDDRARGYVRRVEFVDLAGRTLTESGRIEDERRLAAELGQTGARPVVQTGADDFVGLNARLLTAITDWQLRPQPWDRLAANDHTDHRWDDRVLRELTRIGELLAPVCDPLAAALSRFEGYPQRYAAAMARVADGERSWVDRVGPDSAHGVWLELHEDLRATLGAGPSVTPS